MTISKSSWFYRAWAATYSAEHPAPATASLCPMFWRVVGIWGACVAVAGIFVAGVVGIVLRLVAWVPDATLASAATGIGHQLFRMLVALGLTALVVVSWGLARWLGAALRRGFAGTVVGAMVRAWKDRVCPLVTFTDEARQ